MSKKTVVDAVNDLKADASNLYSEEKNAPNIVVVTCKDDNYINSTQFYRKSLSTSGYFLSRAKPENLIAGLSFACTIDEFNQCVAEMSAGLFVPDCRPNQPEIKYDKDDNGWEVGSVYEFSIDGSKWFLDKFVGVHKLSTYESFSSYCGFIRECQSPIGKIHRKPVELVDGAAYQFNARNKIFNGIYEKDGNKFNVFSGQYFDEISCSNIIRLVPEVK